MAGTLISEGTKIDGTIESEEDLVVRGRVDGAIHLDSALDVQPGGIIVAEVEVETCVVSGAIAGDVAASDSVRIVAGGRMVGDIKAPRVILEPGAAYRGNVDMGNIDVAPSKRPRSKGEAEEPSRASATAASASGAKKQNRGKTKS